MGRVSGSRLGGALGEGLCVLGLFAQAPNPVNTSIRIAAMSGDVFKKFLLWFVLRCSMLCKLRALCILFDIRVV